MKKVSTRKPYFGKFGPCKLLWVVDASSDLKLIIILIIVCINCTIESSCKELSLEYYNHIILKQNKIMLLRRSDYKFQQLIMNMAVLCFHNINTDTIKHYYGLFDHQKHFIEHVSLSMKPNSAFFVGNECYMFFSFFAIMVAYFCFNFLHAACPYSRL